MHRVVAVACALAGRWALAQDLAGAPDVDATPADPACAARSLVLVRCAPNALSAPAGPTETHDTRTALARSNERLRQRAGNAAARAANVGAYDLGRVIVEERAERRTTVHETFDALSAGTHRTRPVASSSRDDRDGFGVRPGCDLLPPLTCPNEDISRPWFQDRLR